MIKRVSPQKRDHLKKQKAALKKIINLIDLLIDKGIITKEDMNNEK